MLDRSGNANLNPIESRGPGLALSPLSVLSGLVFFVFVCAITWKLRDNIAANHQERQQANTKLALSAISSEAEVSLFSRIDLVLGLRAHISVSPDLSDQEFDAIAANLIREADGIRSITSIKDDVINRVFPLEGNKDAIGIRILDIPGQSAAAKKAKASEQPSLSGPIRLVQGGHAFVNRAPVFVTDPGGTPASGRYWGMVSILIDKEILMEEIQTSNRDNDLELAIRNWSDEDEPGIIFWGDPEIELRSPVTTKISFPNGHWTLYGVPSGGWEAAPAYASWVTFVGSIIGLVGGLMLCTLVQATIWYRDYSSRLESANLQEQAAHRAAAEASQKEAERAAQLRVYANQLEDAQQASLNIMEDFQIARNEAEAANRAKSQFLANMSHEIRTPLNSIIVLTEIVARSDLDATQKEHLRTVLDSAESLLTVINDILDFSKIEAGKLDLEQIQFDLRESLGDTLHAFGPRAQARGVELIVWIEQDVPQLLQGDPNRLRQIVTNLVSNAIKFTERGEVQLTVSLADHIDNYVLVRFSIRDTGIGIQPKHLDRIFESFQQADGSTTRRYGGTGLGLAISKQLVELMGGTIHAKSMFGQGSTFEFTALLNEAEKNDPPAVARPELNQRRILILHRNETARQVLERMLEPSGVDTVSCESVEAAIQAAALANEQNQPFQAMVLDGPSLRLDPHTFNELAAATPDILPVVMLDVPGSRFTDGKLAGLDISGTVMKPPKQKSLIDAVATACGFRPSTTDRVDTTPAALDIHSLRILVVDDSPVNRKVALLLLEDHHRSMMVAHNGSEAVQLMQSEAFDLVLMDVEMPEMDGLEATRAIRELEKKEGTRTPIIAMTANALEGDRERCLNAGMDDYVSKPIRQHELFAAIKRVLSHSLNAPDESPEVASPQEQLAMDIIQWNEIEQRFGNSRETVEEIVRISISELGQLLEQLPKRIADEQWRESRRLAHTIKGLFRHFGVPFAIQTAWELESLAGSSSPNAQQAKELYEKLVEVAAPVQQQLDEYLKAGSV